MIKVSRKQLIWIIAALVVGGIIIYLSTLFRYLQIIADASTSGQVVGWAFAGWVFHKISVAWIKLVVKMVWEKARYENK